jgi:hypothetical protein
MTIFAVLAEADNPRLAEQVERIYPDAYKLVPNMQWLVDASGTPKSVADALDIRDGKYGRVVVLQGTANGAGWHYRSLWDWVTAKAPKPRVVIHALPAAYLSSSWRAS